jgi:hypothetical protein
MGDSVPQHTGPNSLIDTHPRTERLQNPTDYHQKASPEMEGLSQSRSSCLRFQLIGVEVHSFLPHG